VHFETVQWSEPCAPKAQLAKDKTGNPDQLKHCINHRPQVQ